MKNSKIMVTRSSLPPMEEFVKEISTVWDNHWLTNNGEKTVRLKKKLEDYLDVSNVTLFTNGHLSLELLIQAMGLTGEVITTPYTFASTTHAIVRNGLTPVFCDVNLDDFTMDTSMIESLITDKTSAILPVHVYGNICNVEEIERIAKKYDLKVIYDAAHAFGVRYKGKGVGTFGDASMFSFHATKVFNTIEGGAVAFGTNDELKITLERIKNFGIKNESVVDLVGSNAKMNEFQAAMGLCNLPYVDENIKIRKKICGIYKERLSTIDGIKLNHSQVDVESNYAYFPIIVDETVFGKTRNELSDILKNHDVFARKYFYPITSAFDCYNKKFDPYLTPNALYLSKRVLTLPLYADLDVKDVERICDIIYNSQRS